MVGVFGAAMAVHSSPKDLRLSAGISGIVFEQPGLDLWIVLGSSETDCWTIE